MTITTRATDEGFLIMISNEVWTIKDRKKFARVRTMIETLKDDFGAKQAPEKEGD